MRSSWPRSKLDINCNWTDVVPERINFRAEYEVRVFGTDNGISTWYCIEAEDLKYFFIHNRNMNSADDFSFFKFSCEAAYYFIIIQGVV